jgi:hypothetical protein
MARMGVLSPSVLLTIWNDSKSQNFTVLKIRETKQKVKMPKATTNAVHTCLRCLMQ